MKTTYSESIRGGALNGLLPIGLIAFSSLMFVVAISPHHLVYDEVYHLEGSRTLLFGNPSLYRFLRGPETSGGSAAGPIFALLHAAFYPLTHFNAPFIRLINPFLLLLTIAIQAYCFHALGAERPISSAFMLLSIPMLWISAGMALTEVPALSLVTTSIALSLWSSSNERNSSWLRLFGGYSLAGIALGAAILGRQTYLPAVTGFALVAIFSRRLRIPAAVALLLAVLLPLPVFVIWGGLRPPGVAGVIKSGVSIQYGLLAFAYLAVVAALVAPSIYRSSWKWNLAAAALSALLNYSIFHIRFPVAKGIAQHVALLNRDYDLVMGCLLVAGFTGFFVSMLYHAVQRRNDKIFLLWLFLTVLMTGTAAGITHQFSSRYVIAAFPFALFVLQPFIGSTRWAAARLVLGSLIGAATLGSYFW